MTGPRIRDWLALVAAAAALFGAVRLDEDAPCTPISPLVAAWFGAGLLACVPAKEDATPRPRPRIGPGLFVWLGPIGLLFPNGPARDPRP